MSYWSDTSYDLPPLAMPRRSSKLLARTLPVVLAFSFSAFVGARMMSVNPPQALPEQGREADSEPKVEPAKHRVAAVPPADQAQTLALLDPNYSLGIAPTTLDESAPLGSNFEQLRPSIAEAEPQESQPQIAESQEAETPAAAPQVAELTKPEPEPEAQTATADVPEPPVRDFAPQTAELVPDPIIAPLPPQRPSALFVPDKNATFRPAPTPAPSIAQAPAPSSAPAPAPSVVQTPPPVVAQPRMPVPSRTRVARAPVGSPAEDNRSFFEKMFGSQKNSGSALAYATPEDGGGLFGMSRVSRSTPSPFAGGGGTAVYEIATHTVYLPNGTTLEAHSGLGEMLDNPGYVHVRMRGPTPPTTYDLTLRESLFHGVQALRLNPVGGQTFGRNGLLAHTFMLGPRGDSNGCVSFRNYRAFLQAFLNGEVKRLMVVARR